MVAKKALFDGKVCNFKADIVANLSAKFVIRLTGDIRKSPIVAEDNAWYTTQQ